MSTNESNLNPGKIVIGNNKPRALKKVTVSKNKTSKYLNVFTLKEDETGGYLPTRVESESISPSNKNGFNKTVYMIGDSYDRREILK